ncbi:hypothetical protein AM571_CH03483 [Rhizobium etli 8C-3]|uniref:Uncharacterized protein n=1 Tax=Rhizobium etli 8C-3 TaxID=538025 RepID=A0A1L5P7X9_RHIET|nr:hypothetical protein AM571_CH03483 [Rhizobium etli 8C-3]
MSSVIAVSAAFVLKGIGKRCRAADIDGPQIATETPPETSTLRLHEEKYHNRTTSSCHLADIGRISSRQDTFLPQFKHERPCMPVASIGNPFQIEEAGVNAIAIYCVRSTSFQ